MSSGSKQRTTTVNNIDSSTNNQQGEINFGGDIGDSNTFNKVTNTTVTDNGAVNKALESSVLNTEKTFNFATSALKFDSEKSARIFEFGNKSVDGAFNLSKTISDNLLKANKDVLSLAQNNARDSYNFVRTLSNPGIENDANNFQTMAKWGALTVTALAIAFMAKGSK
jgi:DNA polymerase I-like protein with 3'-5' exonuclease and polymerase domains